MKIVVLGATGRLGSEVLSQALDAGHQVVAYTRNPSTLPARAGLTVIRGGLDDQAALSDAVSGSDVVVVAVGPRIKLSEARKPTDFMQVHLPLILSAVTKARVRLVLVSANGVGASAAKSGLLARFAYRAVTGGLFEDKRLAELSLEGAVVDWTVVLPVTLTGATANGRVAVKDFDEVRHVPGFPSLPYADAALGVLQVATNPATAGTHQLITSPKGWK